MSQRDRGAEFNEVNDALDAADIVLIVSEPVTEAQRRALELRGD